MPRRALCLSFVLTATAFSAVASANGRFPAASQLVFDPLDNKHAAVRTTFGLLQTTDGGTSWRWICEKALGYVGVYDPAIAIAGDGSIHVGLPDGLARSTDRACTWVRAAAPLASEYIIDLAIDPTAPKRIVAITNLNEGSPMGATAKLFVSADGGATWGAPIAMPEDFRPLTVDLAPGRIYASGFSPFGRFAMIVRSNDGGATWTESTFDMGDGRGAYIAGVDPINPDHVYLRVDGETTDQLLFSSDGAGSFSTLMTGAQLLGFAISPDGKQVAVGGPGVGVHVSGPEHSFAKVADHAVRCLAYSGDALWACGSDPLDPFALGRASKGAPPFATMLLLKDIAPLACAKGTTTEAICPAYWPEVSRTINPVDAGANDATVDDATTPADAAIDREPVPPAEHNDGCGCRAAPRGGSVVALIAVAVAVAIALQKRRTRP